MLRQLPLILGFALPGLGNTLVERQTSTLENCPGYSASNVQNEGSRLTADLSLAGTPCNVYGDDIIDLRLEVQYETGKGSFMPVICWN